MLNVIKAKALDVEVEQLRARRRRTKQTLTVTGLLPGEAVAVMYAATKLTTGKADEDGRFTYSFDVGRRSGEKTVKVVGAIPTRAGEATFDDHRSDQRPRRPRLSRRRTRVGHDRRRPSLVGIREGRLARSHGVGGGLLEPRTQGLSRWNLRGLD